MARFVIKSLEHQGFRGEARASSGAGGTSGFAVYVFDENGQDLYMKSMSDHESAKNVFKALLKEKGLI